MLYIQIYLQLARNFLVKKKKKRRKEKKKTVLIDTALVLLLARTTLYIIRMNNRRHVVKLIFYCNAILKIRSFWKNINGKVALTEIITKANYM